MTHDTKVTQRRNTNNSRCDRARNWCFTLNNYTDKDITLLLAQHNEYLFQEETGKNGTKHLQGILCYTNAVSFNKIKALLPTAHIEKCKNKIASIQYCSKEETRTGEIFTNMKLKVNTKEKIKLPHELPKNEFDEWCWTEAQKIGELHRQECTGKDCWCKAICFAPLTC